MDQETLINELRDILAGLTPNERIEAITELLDGYYDIVLKHRHPNTFILTENE